MLALSESGPPASPELDPADVDPALYEAITWAIMFPSNSEVGPPPLPPPLVAPTSPSTCDSSSC